MFNRKTDYSLNKLDSDAIVYIDAEKTIVRLTREDFSSLEEFLKWKAWSDANYHITEKANHLYADHTLSLTGLPEAVAAVPSPDAMLTERHSGWEQEHLRQLMARAMDSCLTGTQRRRLWLYHVDGLTEKEIALAKNVQQQNVSKSIRAARKKVKTFFRKQGVKTPFQPRQVKGQSIPYI